MSRRLVARDAAATHPFTERQFRGLEALCDTFVAPVRPPAHRQLDPTRFFARRASELEVAPMVAAHLARALPPEALSATGKLLDLIALTGFRRLPQRLRELLLAALRRSSRDVDEGMAGLAGLSAFYFYGQVDAAGGNPFWAEVGYPGPPSVACPPPSLSLHAPSVEGDRVRLDADVVVVGSGSGGGVVAAVLAQAGLDVVVLEAAAYVPEAEMPLDDAAGFARMYWRGGVQRSQDGNLAVLAGATLGGGSTVNWQNCVRTPDAIRAQWAAQHGLGDLDGADFDADLDAVAERISITTACSEHNGANQRLFEGADALGWSAKVAARNVDPARYAPESAGHVGFGDRSGAKLGSLRAWLPDAEAAGARILAQARAERVQMANGRACGVQGSVRVGAKDLPLEVRAATVVVACGALETPALLLRSGIGGPAAGVYLRVHPAPAAFGLYDTPQNGWWGGPMTTVVDAHSDIRDGHGYLIEAGHLHFGLVSASLPWASARQHKQVMAQFGHLAGSLAVVRDHGHGKIGIDDAGHAVVSWPADDPVDQELVWRGVADMIRLHAAAGAHTVYDYALPEPVWRSGDDVERAAARAQELPLGRGGRVPFCAHQMGSARMGDSPASSVANPQGELHDARGVWIGDTSAFPTALGANPMWTCMALARRTARAILAAR